MRILTFCPVLSKDQVAILGSNEETANESKLASKRNCCNKQTYIFFWMEILLDWAIVLARTSLLPTGPQTCDVLSLITLVTERVPLVLCPPALLLPDLTWYLTGLEISVTWSGGGEKGEKNLIRVSQAPGSCCYQCGAVSSHNGGWLLLPPPLHRLPAHRQLFLLPLLYQQPGSCHPGTPSKSVPEAYALLTHL